MALVVESCLPARAVNGSEGCSLLSGAMESIFARYRIDDLSIVHATCEGDADERCTWRLEAEDVGHASQEGQPTAVADSSDGEDAENE